MWTANAAAAYNAYGDGHAWKFSNFRKTDGYVAVPLDGIWLTAPYLHNGSVPTLTDLLEPAARGRRVLARLRRLRSGPRRFRHAGPEAERVGTSLDVVAARQQQRRPHLRHGLTGDEKRALLEYLKTL